MTNEAYVFQQTVSERAKAKGGVFHKKNGSKSKRCTLPSDHLTASQKKKLNGECETINLNKQINSMAELRSYSLSLQTEYLQNCITKHGARKIDLANMLSTTWGSFDYYIKKNGIDLIFPESVPGFRSKMDGRWLVFIGETESASASAKKTDEQIIEEHFGIKFKCDEPVIKAAKEPIIEETIDEPVADVVEEAPKDVSGYNSVLKMSLDLKGSKAEIMKMMNAILGDECNYAMSIKITNSDREEA